VGAPEDVPPLPALPVRMHPDTYGQGLESQDSKAGLDSSGCFPELFFPADMPLFTSGF